MVAVSERAEIPAEGKKSVEHAPKKTKVSVFFFTEKHMTVSVEVGLAGRVWLGGI